MPPQRTFPPVKPIKTERTHEENQERAYIAASRRSDRSLEARVESARRASEIHKRRTGRSLRVTEQDVVNEEMYEEEDDDLPSQYRRLTAHLHTNSPEFNERLQSYLTNHVAMRLALREAMNGNFGNHYPNAPQFAHNSTMFPSPINTQMFGQQPQQPMQSPSAISPSTPHPYRHTPYPMPGHPSFRPNQQRAMSIQMPPQMVPQQMAMQVPGHMSPAIVSPAAQLPSQPAQQFRRSSMPVSPFPTQAQQPAPQQLPSPRSDTSPRALSPAEQGHSKPGSAPASVTNTPVGQPQPRLHQPQPQHPPQQLRQQVVQQPSYQRQAPPQSINIPGNNLAPFTTSLAPNDAAMVNPAALGENDFNALMGNANLDFASFDDSGFGASDPGAMFKPGAHFQPNMAGMNSTLVPDDSYKTGMNSSGLFDQNLGTPGGFDPATFFDFGDVSNGNSAAGTPGDNDSFNQLINSQWQGAGA